MIKDKVMKKLIKALLLILVIILIIFLVYKIKLPKEKILRDDNSSLYYIQTEEDKILQKELHKEYDRNIEKNANISCKNPTSKTNTLDCLIANMLLILVENDSIINIVTDKKEEFKDYELTDKEIVEALNLQKTQDTYIIYNYFRVATNLKTNKRIIYFNDMFGANGRFKVYVLDNNLYEIFDSTIYSYKTKRPSLEIALGVKTDKNKRLAEELENKILSIKEKYYDDHYIINPEKFNCEKNNSKINTLECIVENFYDIIANKENNIDLEIESSPDPETAEVSNWEAQDFLNYGFPFFINPESININIINHKRTKANILYFSFLTQDMGFSSSLRLKILDNGLYEVLSTYITTY